MLWVLAIIIGIVGVCYLCCRFTDNDFIIIGIGAFSVAIFMFLTLLVYTKVSDKYLVTEKVQVSQYDVISFNDENATFKYLKDGAIYIDTTIGKEIIEKDNAKPTITKYKIRKEFNKHKKLFEFLFFYSGPPAYTTETITLPTGTLRMNSN